MRGIVRPEPVRDLRFRSDLLRRRIEEFAELGGGVGPHSLERLGPPRCVVGKRLGRQLRQGVLGLGEEIRPAALGSQFLEDKRSHRVLFGLGMRFSANVDADFSVNVDGVSS